MLKALLAVAAAHHAPTHSLFMATTHFALSLRRRSGQRVLVRRIT